MAFSIVITSEAKRQLAAVGARDRRIIEEAIGARLLHQPTTSSKAIKRLRPNPLVEWELRVGDFRVFYNVDEAAEKVRLVFIGEKRGNKLLVDGEEFHEHDDNPAERTEE